MFLTKVQDRVLTTISEILMKNAGDNNNNNNDSTNIKNSKNNSNNSGASHDNHSHTTNDNTKRSPARTPTSPPTSPSFSPVPLRRTRSLDSVGVSGTHGAGRGVQKESVGIISRALEGKGNH